MTPLIPPVTFTYYRSMRGEGYCHQIRLSFCHSVCAPFCPYNSKTITSIKLKFGGQVFYGVQTDFWGTNRFLV